MSIYGNNTPSQLQAMVQEGAFLYFLVSAPTSSRISRRLPGLVSEPMSQRDARGADARGMDSMELLASMNTTPKMRLLSTPVEGKGLLFWWLILFGR
jgi:hypothetical protein